jgi:hypothetical protein
MEPGPFSSSGSGTEDDAFHLTLKYRYQTGIYLGNDWDGNLGKWSSSSRFTALSCLLTISMSVLWGTEFFVRLQPCQLWNLLHVLTWDFGEMQPTPFLRKNRYVTLGTDVLRIRFSGSG